MTETWGYVCPVCLGWWTTYLNTNGPDKQELYCGCHVRKDRALFLSRKTYGNHCLAKAGVTRLEIEVTWAGEILKFDTLGEWAPDPVIWQALNAKLVEKDDQVLKQHKNLLFVALRKATTAASGSSFKDRCPKCESYRTCRSFQKWMEPSCEEFKLKRSIQEFLDRGKIPRYLQPEVR
jgi:hypothetical protein